MDICTKRTQVIFEPIVNVLEYQSPAVQRLLNEEYVKYLVNDQMKEYNEFGVFSLLQSITCCDVNDKRYVIDGQHRLEAYKILQSQGYSLGFSIPLVCYKVSTHSELMSYYMRINKHNPIQPLEMTDEWLKYGKSFCTWFVSEYKNYVKQDDTKSMCPNINLKSLMMYIKKYNVFQRLPETCEVINFINGIKKLNTYVVKNKERIIQFQLKDDLKKRIDKCEKKCVNNPCMLGIWRNFEWIEMVLKSLTDNISIEDISFSMFSLKRPKIERKKRINVWKKRNGSNMDGICMVCEESLSFEDMECGHIESVFNGGSNDLSNLEPICKTCNRDMGILNLELYKMNFR
jgi:hypothetical protein